MSLILDALRKMEQERRERRGAAQNLRPEVLRYRTASPGRQKEPGKFPLALVGGVLLLCAGVGAGFFLKGEGKSAQSVASPAPAAPVPVPAAAPAVPAPAPAQEAPPLVPAAPPAPAVAAPAPPAAKDAPVAVAAPAPKAKLKSARVEPAPQARPQQEVAPVAQGAAPDITISGIAYQDERRMRRAVLNGTLVGEGAEVAGARVVEIKETKVKLSRGGQVFEVPFSSGLQSR